MNIWVISDLHLCFGAPEKNMEFFGSDWSDYMNKIKSHWKNTVANDDLVLIPGDISWSIKLDKALLDLQWIDSLPGKKLILKGNHDYWWSSLKKLQSIMPPSISILQNNAFLFDDVAIGGARLWDSDEYNFNEYILFKENPKATKLLDTEIEIQKDLSQKIFNKELERLKMSLSQLDKKAKIRIAMTHYPPISADLKDSKASKILEEFNIDLCVFGHLHCLKKDKKLFGEKNNIKYIYASCEYLKFQPLKIY